VRALLAAMKDVVLVLDRDERHLRVAPTSPEPPYRAAEDLLGKTLHDLHPADRADVLLAHLRRALDARETVRFDHEAELRGRPAWFSAAVSPVTDDTVIWVARDVTARKRLEEHVRESQRMAAVAKLAGGIAHEFNNLMTVIPGYGHLILEGLPEQAPGRRETQEIVRAGQRAASLTRQLLAFGRKQVLRPRILAIDEVLRGMEPALRRLMGPAVQVDFDLGPGSLFVEADLDQIRQSSSTSPPTRATRCPAAGA
jgi:PAS domain S-box-containing protein